MSYFDRLDTNHDGILTRAEFNQAVHGAGFPQTSTLGASRALPHFPLPQDAPGAHSWQPAPAASSPAPSYSYTVSSPSVVQHNLQEPVTMGSTLHQYSAHAGMGATYAGMGTTYAGMGTHSGMGATYVGGASPAAARVQPAMTRHAEVLPGGASAAGAYSTLHAPAPWPAGHCTSPLAPTLVPTVPAPSGLIGAAPAGSALVSGGSMVRHSSGITASRQPRLDRPGPGERVVGERPISREELASTGNLIEGPTTGTRGREASTLHTTYGTTGSQLAQSTSMFDRFDRNHDGVISREEFNQATRLGGPVTII